MWKRNSEDAAEIHDILGKAEGAFSSDKFGKAHRLLAPLIEQNVPEAIFMAAGYSKPGETIEKFEQRRLWQLTQAAMRGHAEATYILGVQFDTGVDQIKNSVIASALFEQAAALGHSRAKLSHGLDLVRGTNRLPKDHERGLEFIRQAADAGEEGAAEELERLLAKPTDTIED